MTTLTSRAGRRSSGGQQQQQGSGGGNGGKGKTQDQQQRLWAWSKYWTSGEEWDRDELGDAIHWLRQALGLVCGIIWGLIPLTGGTWLVTFLLLDTALGYLYYAYVLGVDEEDYGGHAVLLQEGLLVSFGLFLLSWIMVYTCCHFP